MRLQTGLAIVVVVLALGVYAAVYAADKTDAPRCENCGMYWEKSPTRIDMSIEVDGKAHQHKFECFGCMHDFIHENYGEVMPQSIQVLDYSTFGTDKPVMLDAFKAYYLNGTDPIKGSMAPFVAAFSTEEAASAHQEEMGGEVIDFKQMKQAMMKAKGETEAGPQQAMVSMGDGETVYVCQCTGGCCDDVRESAPGTCPKCGMELVPEQK